MTEITLSDSNHVAAAPVTGSLVAADGSDVGVRLLAQYEAQLGAAREQFDQHSAVVTLFHGAMAPAAMEAFLIAFAVVGVRMTEPVESWIRRAGRRCGELGMSHLAKALDAHAHQEADHHLLMLADAEHLVEQWNRSRRPELSVPVLLDLKQTPGVTAYRTLHENVIEGPAPYGQLAIEYEIEMLSVRYGPRLVSRCNELLGSEILEGLSFLREHVDLDVGHTKFNRLQLSRFLAEQPDCLSGLVAAGAAALRAYAMFLDDCVGLLQVGAPV